MFGEDKRAFVVFKRLNEGAHECEGVRYGLRHSSGMQVSQDGFCHRNKQILKEMTTFTNLKPIKEAGLMNWGSLYNTDFGIAMLIIAHAMD